jgi:hypothetical protein
VAVGEEAEQHELERLALSDDRLLDLVEHAVGSSCTCERSTRWPPASRRLE